jgi:ribosomal-protein-serine acetyltransferase
LELQDAEVLYQLIDKNRAFLSRWLPWVESTSCVEDSSAFIESAITQYEHDKSFEAGIYMNNRLIGMCGIHPIDTANNTSTIGYWLDKAHTGHGIATLCARFLIDYALRELKLSQISIVTHKNNSASIAIADRLKLNLSSQEDDKLVFSTSYYSTLP